MDIENTINLNNKFNQNLNLQKAQNNFLNGMFGEVINTGLDIGIRATLPDFIEDQIIDIKNNLLEYGLKDGIRKTIEDAINVGKSAIGIVTGNFENTTQIQTAIKNGGLIDNFSKVFDIALNKIEKKGLITSNVSNIIKQGKNIILDNVENNLEKKLNQQNIKSKNLNKYINNWKKEFKNQNFNEMEKQYNNIKKELKDLVPLEKSIKDSHTIENLHTIIKTNGHNFNLSETEKELLNKL